MWETCRKDEKRGSQRRIYRDSESEFDIKSNASLKEGPIPMTEYENE